MRPTLRPTIATCAALTALLAAPTHAASQPRLELGADSGWKFFPGDPSGAEARSFPDAAWRTVNLPHDWSIEGLPEKSNPTSSGGGYFPAGTGWYRKTFHAPSEWNGKRVSVEFDGVYRDAAVYLNGRKLGNQRYGYTSFRFDLTLSWTSRGLTSWRCAWTTPRNRTAAGTAGQASTGMCEWW